MNWDTTVSDKHWRMLSAFIIAFVIICASNGVLAADKSFIVSTDANTYEPGAEITVSGTMYDGTDPAVDGSVIVASAISQRDGPW